MRTSREMRKMSDGHHEQTSWSNSKWLSKNAAAKYIHRSPTALQALLDSGAIPASQAPFERGGSKVIYISIDDLDAYMRSTPYKPSRAAARETVPVDRQADAIPRPQQGRREIPRYRAIAHARAS